MADDSNNRSGSSRTIGHLTQQIVSSLRPSDGTTDASVTKPNSSATTTGREVTPGPTGQRSGTSGFVVQRASSPPDPEKALRNPAVLMPPTLRGSLKSSGMT